jgi:hypothetical protein
VSVAVAVSEGGPFVEVTGPAVFVLSPPFVPVTATVIVHDDEAPTVPPDNETLVAPAVGAKVPPHVFVGFGELATSTLAGKVSETATPESGKFARLPIVNVIVLVPFRLIVLGENDFVRVGATVTVAWAGTEPARVAKPTVTVDNATSAARKRLITTPSHLVSARKVRTRRSRGQAPSNLGDTAPWGVACCGPRMVIRREDEWRSSSNLIRHPIPTTRCR